MRGRQSPENSAPTLRASDADREAVVEELRAHCAAGRLTVDELAERIGVAYAARTIGDLQAVRGDLPSFRPASAALSEALDRALVDAMREGWRLESRSERHAVMVADDSPNHLMHAVLTVLTGVWAVIWIAAAVSNRKRWLLVEVDELGRASFERLR